MRYQTLDASVVVMQLTGDVLVVNKQGVTHLVKIGEHLPAGSMLILEGNASVDLEPYSINTLATQPSTIPDQPSIATPLDQTHEQTGQQQIYPVGLQGLTDITVIQKAIQQGIDPTLNFEATAAGGAPGAGGGGATGSGNGGFVSIDRTGASTLATAGFETSHSSSNIITVPNASTVQDSNNAPSLNVDPGNNGANDQVFEAGLPQGSAAGDGSTLAYGSFTLSDADGLPDIKTVTINGTSFAVENLVGTIVAGTHGNLTVTGYDSSTGVANYQYTLTSPATDGPGIESDVFTLSVSDGNSQSTPASITINIVDDVPLAVADNNSVTEDGDNLTITGGVLANDLHANGQPGADVPVSFMGWIEPVAQYGSFVDLGNGQYQYTLNNGLAAVQALDDGQTLTEKFSYQIQDADGDPSTTTLTITIQGSNDTPTINVSASELTVSEAGLSNGSDPSSTSAVTAGQFIVGDPDGLDDITSINIAGTTLNIGTSGLAGLVNSTVDTGYGSLLLTSYSNGIFNYRYTLTAPVDNDSKPGANSDGYIENVALAVSDGSRSASTSFNVYITDDQPNATNIGHSEQATASIDTNLLITLDISGSMGDSANYGGLTRLEAAKQSIFELFEQYEAQGNVKVKIVTFSDNGTILGTTWQTITEAKSALLSLSPQNMTNYDDALADTITAFSQPGKLAGAQNVAYFLSDGEPNEPTGSAGINSSEEQAWTKFLNDNDIHSYALGMGAGSTASALDPVAYDGTGTGTNTNSQIITDFSQLTSTLVTIAHASPLSGTLTSGGTFGADGGHIESIVVGGVTYTFDGITIHDSDGGSLNNATYNNVTHLLSVSTTAEGKISVDMDNGLYQYTPPANISTIIQEMIGFTLVDNDGDRDSASLQITIDPAASPLVIRDDFVVTNTNAIAGNDTIVIPEWALLANDTGYNSDLLTIHSVANAAGGSVTNGAISITFTESSASDTNGGSFSYTAAISGTTLNDLGDVSIDRSQIGHSTLDGTYRDEILLGRDTNNDTINGNGGDDVLIGLGGNDTLNGGYGNDTLAGGAGNDKLNGGSGIDTATYIDSPAAVTVSLAITTAQDTGGAGTDILLNIENLTGSSYSDTLTGNSENNIITGGAGNDKISGGGGNDILLGGLGADILTGGSGEDVFKFTTADKDGNTDTIQDFTLNHDKLDLSDVLNDPTGSLSNYLSVTNSGDDAIVKVYCAGNASGGGVADMMIVLDGLGTHLQDLQDYLHNDGVIK